MTEELKNRISLALKDPILQQGFECICKDLAISEHDREHNDYELTEVYKKVEQLEQENAELKETVTKMNNVITETFSNLTKAKELLQRVVKWATTETCKCEKFDFILADAKQFLNSEVEK